MRTVSWFILLFLCVGCATTSRDGDFVTSVNFTPYDSFAVRPAITSGFNWDSAEEHIVDRLSERVLAEELEARGFVSADDGEADFYAVTKWRKYSGYRASMFDPVDSVERQLARENPARGFAVRHSLVLEIYDGASDELFWRAELPDIFEAIRFSESRVTLALQQAISDFPNRVDKDPNLPNIE